MSPWQYIARSLTFHARAHLAVVLGIAVATAVLTGALLVGDSMTGSLRDLTLDRLGRIDQVLLSPGYFRAKLAEELAAAPAFQAHYADALPAILLPRVTCEKPDGNLASATALGCDDRFWTFDRGVLPPPPPLDADGVILNEPLATDLAVQVGEEIIVRLPKVANIPSDSALGKKEQTLESLRLKVQAIVPAEGLGRFSLFPSQHQPRTLWTRLAALQQPLELLPGRKRGGLEEELAAEIREPMVNALLVAGRRVESPGGEEATRALHAALRPRLIDLGLQLDQVRMRFRPAANEPEQTALEYFRLTSRRMMIGPATDAAVVAAWGDLAPQPVFTYLANTIAKVGPDGGSLPPPPAPQRHEIPYSTIVGIDSVAGLGPLLDEQGQPIRLQVDEIALNRWTAEQLGAQPGDTIRIVYFEPESAHGATRESHRDFRLRAITPLVPPSEKYERDRPAEYTVRPSLANDPFLTPVVKGLTDRDSLADWDAPFEYDARRIRPPDEDYWDNYRGTPKAFVSLAAGRAMWSSRFGETTGYRLPIRAGQTLETIEQQFLAQLGQEGDWPDLAFQPVKAQGLAAAGGTVPFNGLFLGFSLFLIAAAVILTALLFRLAIEQRAAEIGILTAMGVPRGAISGWLTCEGLVIAAVGAALGAAGGVLYAWLMLVGLRTLWLDAVTTPFLTLHVTWPSLAIGLAMGLVVAWAVIWYSLRDLVNVAPRTLLAGQASDASSELGGRQFGLVVTGPLGLLAVGLVLLASQLGGEAQAGAFFGAGAALLTAVLVAVWDRLVATSGAPSSVFSLAQLALSNAGRAPGRTTLTIGLVAAASFLIIAISAFHLEPTESGTGGFDFVAESDQAVFQDLNSAATRRTLGIDAAAEPILAASALFALRLQPGDDASCLNLFQPARPRALGISPALVNWFDDPQAGSFKWAGSLAAGEAEVTNPWRVLQRPIAPGTPIPVVLDKNTAMYSLHLYGGVGQEFELPGDGGPPRRFVVAGLLGDSILQGYLLMSEEHLVELYPEVSGYRYFLIRGPRGDAANEAAAARATLKNALQSALRDQGFLATDARQRLASLLAVQNTYLSTFRSLGALGLLLGACGLAAVQLRNVLERRGELALLRAEGFTVARLTLLVLLETIAMLAAGLGVGAGAALVAVSPQLTEGSAAVPLLPLAVTLALVLAAGILTTWLVVARTLREPLLPALRGE